MQTRTRAKFTVEQVIAAFNAKVSKSSECWIWIGKVTNTGYGEFKVHQKQYKAHRFSYTAYVGDIPDGGHVLHSCDNPLCVRPDHLFIGTHQDNIADCIRKGRQCKGEQKVDAKLKDADVIAIRESRASGTSLAKTYDVSQMTISRVRRFAGWKHVQTGA